MYTIGSDPEFFVIDNREIPVPAFENIKRGKDKPFDLKDGFSMFYDNVTLEGNIPPSDSLEEFVKNIRRLKLKMNAAISAFKWKIKCSSSEVFYPGLLDNKKAQEFGCSAFFNAWTFREEESPSIKSHTRVAGFHIHVGYENTTEFPNELVNFAIARMFDFFVIYPSQYTHRDEFRDKYYGGFGKFRHKPYGIELRSLGGYFLKDQYLPWVYEQTIKTVDYVLKCEDIREILDLEPSDICVKGAREKLNFDLTAQFVRTNHVYQEPLKLVV